MGWRFQVGHKCFWAEKIDTGAQEAWNSWKLSHKVLEGTGIQRKRTPKICTVSMSLCEIVRYTCIGPNSDDWAKSDPRAVKRINPHSSHEAKSCFSSHKSNCRALIDHSGHSAKDPKGPHFTSRTKLSWGKKATWDYIKFKNKTWKDQTEQQVK
jgi:hypothetical protein